MEKEIGRMVCSFESAIFLVFSFEPPVLNLTSTTTEFGDIESARRWMSRAKSD